jgi:hypothetical protein
VKEVIGNATRCWWWGDLNPPTLGVMRMEVIL